MNLNQNPGDGAQETISATAFQNALSRETCEGVETFVDISTVPHELLKQLIAIEIRHRLQKSESLSADEYYSRFPELPKADLDQILANESQNSATALFSENDDTGQSSPQVVLSPVSGSVSRDVPETIGRFQVVQKLGAGQMGVVYLANDPMLSREVAIKVPKFLASRGEVAIYLEEARRLAAVDHPNIVPVYDASELPDGSCFVVFKYIKGATLQEYTQHRKLTPEELVEFIAPLADALQAIHQREIVHRDVKPANILIDETGTPMLADFGLALNEEQLTEYKGQRAGSPAFMAPEQVLGKTHHLDGRADIWALGVVLYQLSTGKLPFTGSVKETFDQIINRPVKSPRLHNPELTPAFERIVLKCLQKEVEQRYTTAADLARDLRLLQQSPNRKKWWIAAGCAAAAVLAVAAATFLRSGSSPADTERLDQELQELSRRQAKQIEEQKAQLERQHQELMEMVRALREQQRNLAEPEKTEAAQLANDKSGQLLAGIQGIPPESPFEYKDPLTQFPVAPEELEQGPVRPKNNLRQPKLPVGKPFPAGPGEARSFPLKRDDGPPFPANLRVQDTFPVAPLKSPFEEPLRLPEIAEAGPLPEDYSKQIENIEAARNRKNVEEELSLLLKLTNQLHEDGRYAHSLPYAARMVELAHENRSQSQFPVATGQLGIALYKTGRSDEAVVILEMGLREYVLVAEKLNRLPKAKQVEGSQSRMARMIGIQSLHIGNALKAGCHYQKAAGFYTEAEKQLRKHQRTTELQTLLLNYGSLKSTLGMETEAILMLEEGLTLARNANDIPAQVEYLTNLGQTFSQANQTDLAVPYFEQAWELASDELPYSLRTSLYHNGILTLLEAENKQKALTRIREYQQFARENDPQATSILKLLPALEQKRSS